MYSITKMTPDDWPQVRAIYLEGILTKNATFQTITSDWETWDTGHIQSCRLVCRDQEMVVGWAALSAISRRQVYAGVAEVSIYLTSACQGRGIGKMLLSALIDASEQAGFWMLQAGIFPENVASVRLHEKCGFRIVGHREKIGKMDDRWRDVLLLERRSKVIGI